MTRKQVREAADQAGTPEFVSQVLLDTRSVTVRDIACGGTCRHKSSAECTTATHLVYAYRGAYVRHLGSDDAVAESSQVLFFNALEEYRVSHPVRGGDGCLDLVVDESLLQELTPAELLQGGARFAYRRQRVRIDPRAQALVALLRHGLRQQTAELLEAESLALTLVRRSLGPRTTHAAAGTSGRQRLVDRIKLLLATDLSRRWTLTEIASEVGGSPVYLTQVFQQVEGVPLYRYQLRLRLACALNLLGEYEDLTALSFELGFSSHSHFTSAFRSTYGRSPSEFRRSVLQR